MEIWRQAGLERQHRTALEGQKQIRLEMTLNLIAFTAGPRTLPLVQCCLASCAKWRRMKSRRRFNRWLWTIWPYALTSQRMLRLLSLSSKEIWACSKIQVAWARTTSRKPAGWPVSSTTKYSRGPVTSVCQQCRSMDR